MRLWLLVILLAIDANPAFADKTLDFAKPLHRIAFGSCAMQFKPQPIWDAIALQEPDLFLFLGDNIYGDFDGKNTFTPSANTLKRDWQLLANEPHFNEFRKTMPIMATWDNHDYGKYDGGAEFGLREISQQIFLDFFDEPGDSPRRLTPGIYDSKIIGPIGKRVQVILLDTRYFKGPFIKDPRSKAEKIETGNVGSMASYIPNADPEVTLLGDSQWTWLATQLKLPAEIRLVVSSTQVVADQKAMDEWGNYPLERQRLLDMLARSTTGTTIMLSGNAHFSEISAISINGHALIDFTSSGMTHSNQSYAAVDNSYRVAGPYDDLNFGLLEIDWDGEPSPTIKLTTMSKNGEVVFSHKLLLKKPS